MRLSWAITDWACLRLMRRRHYGAFAAVRAVTRTLRVARALVMVPVSEVIAVPVLWALGEGWRGGELGASVRGILSDHGFGSVATFWLELILWMKWRWPGRVFPLLEGDARDARDVLREQFGPQRGRAADGGW